MHMKNAKLIYFISAITLFSKISCAICATFSYNDIKKPNGKPRGLEALTSDAHFCDQKVGQQTDFASEAYNKCMLSRGWKFSHTE
jgi:hypothetical protein